MDKYIQIKNCNCVLEATIKIVENSLNIKYGPNGTGKSTISEAIFAHTSDKLDRLASLKPYGSDESSLIFGVNCLRHNAMRSSLKREREQSQGSAREAGCGLCSRPQGGRNK